MNIVLWILQAFLALHTAIGAGWKLFNSEQAVPPSRRFRVGSGWLSSRWSCCVLPGWSSLLSRPL
jgi:hypothetical protein